MRRDRQGEPLELEPDAAELDSHAQLLHRLLCDDGWCGEDGEGRPRPCPICRPHVQRWRTQLRKRQLAGH